MATPQTGKEQEESSNASAKPGLRKPVFTKVDQLKPGTGGHTLIGKVLNSDTVLQKGRSVSQHLRKTRIAECLIGDETASIIFTARNDQEYMMVEDSLEYDANHYRNHSSSLTIMILNSMRRNDGYWVFDLMKPGTTVILRNAKIDMFKGSMRLAVDKWGRVEVTEPAEFVVKEDNNLSLVEYELVSVGEE
ncbi:unnamed protein product [Dovyalis caffra]|uniref:Single-stranded DNA binding protein Ssb-like OB fold domain-containing protein n=1 Tax=Dovyalis caffra TaxID=77055 RepID=A0AAV1R3Y2_9ROSI|nr:unnamed protein product [Dovyalis caffra]